MLRLLHHFYPRFRLKLLATVVAIWLVQPVQSATGQGCNTSPIYAFSQALYWSQYEKARQLLPRIKAERNSEMADFLTRVLNWKLAYDNEDSKGQGRALRAIDTLIKTTQKRLEAEPTLALSAGNMMIHAARLNLLGGRVLHAARLAKRGNQLLTNVLAKNPAEADAYLAVGLYQTYSANQDTSFSWVQRLLSLHGNEVRGRELLENAMAQSTDFAFEAARSLKMELEWNKNDVCLYPDLSAGLEAINDQTLFVLQQEISVDLFCGRAKQARKSIQRIQKQQTQNQLNLDSDQQRWLADTNLYALSQRGEVALLSAIVEETSAQGDDSSVLRAQFSLAKALDVNGDQAGAKQHYQSLLNSKLESAYKALARQYLMMPYQAPVIIEVSDRQVGAGMMLACGG